MPLYFINGKLLSFSRLFFFFSSCIFLSYKKSAVMSLSAHSVMS